MNTDDQNIFKNLCKGETQQEIIKFIKKFIDKKPSDLDFNTFLDSMTKSDEIFSNFVIFVDCFDRESKSFKLMSNAIFSACQNKHVKYEQYYQKIVGRQDNKISKLIEKKEVYLKGVSSDNLILKGKMVILPTMNSEIVADEICEFIKKTVHDQKKTGAIVGLSGGIDSAVVTLLALRAFKNTGYEIKAYIIPSNTNESKESIRASDLCKSHKIDRNVVHMSHLVYITEKFLGVELNSFDKGNMTSRIRANILSTYAAVENKVLLGTGNQDEDYGIGYYTLFGDGAVHCSPISELSKRLVYQMGGYLNVPNEILIAAPTAGLEKGQTDYGDLGYGYDIVEFFIEAKHQLVSLKDAVKEATERKFKYDVNKFPNIAIVWNDIISRHNIAQEKMKIIHPPSPVISLNYKGDL